MRLSRILEFCFALLLLSVSARAQEVTLAWDPSSELDLAGYNVYRSTTSGSGYEKINQGPVPPSATPTFTESSDKSGFSAVYYVVTAVNTAGLESEFSNQVSYVVPTDTSSPPAPQPEPQPQPEPSPAPDPTPEPITRTDPAPDRPSSVLAPARVDLGTPWLANPWIGVALVNPGSTANSVVVRAKTAEGAEQTQVTFDTPISAFGQRAFLSSEIAGIQERGVTLLAQGRQAPIQGLFLIGDRDLRHLDGLGGGLKQAETLYLPSAGMNLGTTSQLIVHNPGDHQAQLEAELMRPDGTRVARINRSIPPGGTFSGTHDRMFGSLGRDGGYVKLTATHPLQSFQLTVDGESLCAVSAQEGTPTGRMFAPHFFVDARQGTSQISLLNVKPEAVGIMVRALDNSGRLLSTRQLNLEGNSLLAADLKELLDIDPEEFPGGSVSGYLELEIQSGTTGENAEVLGTITFAGNNGKFRSTLPLLREAQPETLLPHLAQSRQLGIFTGLAVLNPGDRETAQVSVKTYDESGNITAQARFALAPGERKVGLLDEAIFFGEAFEQINGHLRISSTEPVLVFGLFGADDLEYLSAIEVQRPLE